MNRESKAKHTPAPWRAEEGYDNAYNQSVIEISSYATEQFVTIWSGNDYVDDTTKATARLIAASPEMYEMLKSCLAFVDVLDLHGIVDNWSDRPKLVELIKKIEG